MNGNPRTKGACSRWQVPIRVMGRVKDLSDTEEVLNTFEGPHEVGSSCQACEKYTKEERCQVPVLAHKVDMCPTNGTQQEPEDIVFTEAGAK